MDYSNGSFHEVLESIVDSTREVFAAEWASEAGIIALLATVVALLIPVAILLIDTKQNNFPLDRSIVFRNIFLYKDFVALIIPVAISYIFPAIRLLSLIATIYLAILGIIVLLKMFKWLSLKDDKYGGETFKQAERINYLKNIKDVSEIIDVWFVILNSNYELINQRGLLDVFIDHSELIKNCKDYWMRERFWGLLGENLDKIKYENIETYNRLVSTALSYYFEHNNWAKNDEKNINERPPEALRKISQKLMLQAIDNSASSTHTYIYFDEVEKYFKMKDDWRDDDFSGTYLDDLIRCFIENGVDVHKKWTGDFFKRVMITKDNFKERSVVWDSYYRSVLECYVEKSTNPPDEMGMRMSSVTERILIEIDPIIWFRVITFIVWPYECSNDEYEDAENKVRNWCARSRNYGIFGRLECSVSAIAYNERKEVQEEIARRYADAEAKNQLEATYCILREVLCEKLNFSLYKKAIRRLKRQKLDDVRFKEKLGILEKTLAGFQEYLSENNNGK